MIPLDASLRRLMVETSLMAVNHGFHTQARTLLAALPLLTENHEAQKIIEATLLIGLGENKAAALSLKGNTSPDAEILRRLLTRGALSH
ncbi:EscG/YscG/SsaH family type III secretion system needle protein co-chaperone [Rouxiella badensis]|jgi:type III secretion system SsaH family protein|uniref:EscG/YscG/SsaH family type III secretion system needle protein co-chaperone n=1 Tax=Rouxiella badensis TaxID=1646377 RepID=A0A1X0WI38_9GAMM|nr:EscG/YscG/SsaH family type III secretion system needle protein co-chaperone [Rouxiella badensis]MCC3703337.1 EscG/YscG/SsaH family type III secretion system needle protein co-chaperone [Rouxiella badensis]MCC3718276.1 EscG/YscG/SsaH family type III secretion system needle protein co-chaperone [Rouxiella badensis]MCC3726956.1 EscG/YscG/SsaH family type III secretion system needle protein co-chaperone [Rouxiella badensis]MCC3731760.1 EscG/YscG/SsaH family type III secretion system needle prote